MTHTLHRTGDRESLMHDFPTHCMSAGGFNRFGDRPDIPDHRPHIRRYLEISHDAGAINYGEGKIGNLAENGYDYIHDNLFVITHALFTEPEQVTEMLTRCGEEEIGMSVTCAGLFDVLFDCCRKAHLHPNCIEESLGVMGDEGHMLDDKVAVITTMCGHGQISQAMVFEMLKKIKRGEITAMEASTELNKYCSCGIFNIPRGAQLLQEYTALYTVIER